MTVLDELLDWSIGRPAWQRDALRRLVLKGELSTEDIRDLGEICKAAHGLAGQRDVRPLSKADLPDRSGISAPVSLASIFHHRGVNALAESQTLTFSSNLTVVYGDNAAGKTGYIRILKSACRARGRERILGNVVSGTSPLKPIVAIKYRVGSEKEVREWAGEGEDEFISRVSVFDAQSAGVYLTEKTDVAFRPFGLDLFDKLVKACKGIRAQLEREQRLLASNAIARIQAKVAEETAAGRLLANITSLTEPETVRGLSSMSAEEESRLALVERSIGDLMARDPQKLARELQLREGRLIALSKHIKYVEATLSQDAVATMFETRTEGRAKRDEAETIRERTFQAGMLDGTGSEPWVEMWESARRFSRELAYPDDPFPATHDGASCVLCQQNLDHAARHRLDGFEAFRASTVEKDLQRVRERFVRLRNTFAGLDVQPEPITEAIQELRIESEDAAQAIQTWLAKAEDRCSAVLVALSEDRGPDHIPSLPTAPSLVDAVIGVIQERVTTLRSSTVQDARTRLNSEAKELRARKVLAEHEEAVIHEIERKRRYAAYSLCIEDTRTQGITRKSSAITRASVTEKLKESFQIELSRLGFRQVEVELTNAGGTEGVSYHKIVLTRAPGVELPKVVSEGEQRCLSIAAFFAELSTADDPSAIVFDDPVSSLDYKWREAVAQRLVEEAKVRQVVVFTHDVVFLLAVKAIARDTDVEHTDQHVRNLAKGSGVCVGELPWVALKVGKRIGHLRQLFQEAEKLHRNEHQDAYEKEASVIYGLLREAWERGLEEVLLGGVVERFRPVVQTMQVGVIADITPEDCKAVERAITKCSKWLPGHDQAAAAPVEMPEPDVVRSDIEALADWVEAIRKRRQM